MPTVLSFGRLRIVIYPNDHRPAHVHVVGQGHEAVFVLNRRQRSATVRENYGFAKRDLSRIRERLNANFDLLLEAWERIHGEA
jgi:hypothetical protein